MVRIGTAPGSGACAARRTDSSTRSVEKDVGDFPEQNLAESLQRTSPRNGLVARHAVNAVVFYERGPLSARLAWNRRGPFLVSVSDTRSNPRFARAHAQWDAGIAWRLSEAVTPVAEGINLGDGNVADYNLVGPVSAGERMRLVSNTGRRLQAGVRVSFGRGARRRER